MLEIYTEMIRRAYLFCARYSVSKRFGISNGLTHSRFIARHLAQSQKEKCLQTGGEENWPNADIKLHIGMD
jgi:hypothetical protein